MELIHKAFGKKISVSRQGWVTIGGQRLYARSGWESNICAYAQFLKEYGQIKSWRHEPKTFYFEGIKRGVCSYMPDIEIIENDGKVKFWEVKGYLDSRSKTKIARFRKYYPQFELRVIGKKEYLEISKSKSFIKYWGLLAA